MKFKLKDIIFNFLGVLLIIVALIRMFYSYEVHYIDEIFYLLVLMFVIGLFYRAKQIND